MSDISSPFSPFVIEHTGYTFAKPASFALSRTYLNANLLSKTGFVFGMNATAVTPPFTAAFVPDSIVSLYSKPGSLKCT